MNQVITITLHSERRRDPYAGFRGTHAKKMLKLFREGAQLYVWRQTLPHNWWLETSTGVSHTVSGDQATNENLGIVHLSIPSELKQLGRQMFKSRERIALSDSHRDGGKHLKEGWVFDSFRVGKMEKEWAELRAAVQYRKENPPEFGPDLQALSTTALALLRMMKESRPVYPYEELLQPLEELDRQGFLSMNEKGEFYLHDPAWALDVPAGEVIQLKTARAR
jgi:hypothetical protein